jgi:acyl-CoA synthetase (NDP forming)
LDNTSIEIVTKLKLLFEPRSIAFLGASSNPGKWGFRILSNLVSGGFQGRIYPVNPNKGEILGVKVYGSVEDIPETPDLAVIVVSASSVATVVKDCVTKGIKAGLVITAGFAEVGTEGEKLQREFVEVAREAGMRLAGPNSNGVMNPTDKLYCQMPPLFPPPGPFAIVSQSGNLAGAIVQLVMEKGFGFSKYISSGNEADLHAEDYLKYLEEDPQTKVILSYIEGFKNGLRFLETAKEVSKKKPIVMLKAGETPAGATAAKSHTAALTGSDTVFEAMCKQSGVIRVRGLDELVNTGLAFIWNNHLPRGRRVGIVTAGGGCGVLAADACARLGLEVVSLPPETIRELDSFMPAWWSRGNPVDLVASAFGDVPAKCVEVLLRCPVVDGVIMLGLRPTLPPEQFSKSSSEDVREKLREAIVSGITRIFEQLNGLAERYDKPIIVAAEHLPFGADLANQVIRTIVEREYVCYNMPQHAATAFASLAQYSEYLRQNGV